MYPAFRRLAALGYAPDADTLALPWTRQQCLMLLQEAEDYSSRRAYKEGTKAVNENALRLIADLRTELDGKEKNKPGVRIDSVYSRLTQISGRPLNDSYHFGQTLINDFGRPFGEGTNGVTGVSASASAGRWSAAFRGEYQGAADSPTYTEPLRNLIGNLDGIPPNGVRSPAGASQFRAFELYAGVRAGPFDVTVGKQSLWWGPDSGSAYLFSNNADPFYALRIRQAEPWLLPGLLRHFGRIRTEFVAGRLTGHQFPSGPWIHAQKITLQLTPDFEIGFSRSTIFGGEGHPITAGNLLSSFFSTTSTGGTGFGARSDPGDRRSSVDFRWRVPKLRYVTVYSDSLADDEPNPLANPKRAAWAPGVYVSHLPRLPKVDLRAETYSTWLYRQDEGGKFLYWNDQYRDGYTNDGFLLGSWVGRDARTYQLSSTYWESGTNTITADYRQTKIGSAFLPGGGTQTDIALIVQRKLKGDLLLAFAIQGERYNIPALGKERSNVSFSVQLTYRPTNWSTQR